MPFNFMQLGASLIDGMAAMRRALARGGAPASGSFQSHSVSVGAPGSASHRPASTASRVPSIRLLSRLAQVFRGGSLPMRTLSDGQQKRFATGVDKVKAQPEPLKPVFNEGPAAAETFIKDLSRNSYFLADAEGRPQGQQLSVLTSTPTPEQLSRVTTAMLERLGGDERLFQQVSQFAQQGGLVGVPILMSHRDNPIKLGRLPVYVAENGAEKSYAVGLRRPGVAVVTLTYSQTGITQVQDLQWGRVYATDPSRSRLKITVTVEVDREGNYRIVKAPQCGSEFVKARPQAETR